MRPCLPLVLALSLVACTAGAPQQPATADTSTSPIAYAPDVCPDEPSLPADVEPPRSVRTPTPPAPRVGAPDGYACVEVTVDTAGRVSDPEVVATNNTVFGNSFARTVRTWRFEPATRDGEPVEVRCVLFSGYRRR